MRNNSLSIIYLTNKWHINKKNNTFYIVFVWRISCDSELSYKQCSKLTQKQAPSLDRQPISSRFELESYPTQHFIYRRCFYRVFQWINKYSGKFNIRIHFITTNFIVFVWFRLLPYLKILLEVYMSYEDLCESRCEFFPKNTLMTCYL